MDNPNLLDFEIKDLNKLLEAKKQELAGQGQELPEKDLFKEVFKTHVQQVAGGAAVVPTAPSVAAATPAPVDPQEQVKLEELVKKSFTNGLMTTINEARNMNDPYLLDKLHDRLADEYYQKLVEARQINPT